MEIYLQSLIPLRGVVLSKKRKTQGQLLLLPLPLPLPLPLYSCAALSSLRINGMFLFSGFTE